MSQILGYITKEMYYKQETNIRSVYDLKLYKLPIKTINSWDISRAVYFTEEGVVLESLKTKSYRLRGLHLIEKDENKPVVNDLHVDSVKESDLKLNQLRKEEENE